MYKSKGREDMYTKKTVVVIDIKATTPETLYCFREFLRTEMIAPILSSDGLDEKRVAYFAGCFTPEASRRVETWLHEHGIDCCEVVIETTE